MTIIVSRSAIKFMRRHGMRPTPRVPMPRLDVLALHTHDIPLKRGQLDPNLLLVDAEGHPGPDRGRIDIFPPPQLVQTNPEESEYSE